MRIFWAIVTILTMFIGVDFSGRSLKVEEVWVRAASAGSATTVFLTIKNGTSEGDTMFNASSKVADSVTITQTANNNGIEQTNTMKDGLAVNANQTLVLKPHGIYLVLNGLQKTLVPGDSIPIALNFTKAGLIETKAHVEASNATLYDNF